MRKSYKVTIVYSVLFLFLSLTKQTTWALEVKILGPKGTTLAPNTEYAFGVWLRDPTAVLNAPNPKLKLSVSGGAVTSYRRGTFDGIGFEDDQYTWESMTLFRKKGLIGYVEIRTNSSGGFALLLTGRTGWTVVEDQDQKSYTIAPLTGESWAALKGLATSRALTNADFASLYTSFCNNTMPPIEGYELFNHLPESQENALRAVKLLSILLGGLSNPASGLADIFLAIEQDWVGLPDFLGVFYLWDQYTGATSRYTWYYLNVASLQPLPLGPISTYTEGYLTHIRDKETNEATAWEAHDALAALGYLDEEEEDINRALSIAEVCLSNATNNDDDQGHDFFRGLKKHLKEELNVINKLKWVVGDLVSPEILDDSTTSVEPADATPGDTIMVRYHIRSWYPDDVNAWLGATIRKHDDHNTWTSDKAHDKPITLKRSINPYDREFTIPADFPYGIYDVEFGIHSGNDVNSGVIWDRFWKNGILTLADDDNVGPVGSNASPNGVSRAPGFWMFSIELTDPSGIYEENYPRFYGRWDNPNVDETHYNVNEVAAPAGGGEYRALISLPQNRAGSTLYWRCLAYDNDNDRPNDRAASWSPATGAYAVSVQETVETPTFDPDGGTHTSPVDVTINCATAGATIHYTTNGTTPTANDPIYTAPINISTTTTLKAKGFKTDWLDSAVKSADYTITGTVATPTFNPDGGTYTNPVDVTISCTTPGATIRYTTNGTTPTASDPAYTAPINISSTTTLKAKGFKTDWNPSGVAADTYVIRSPMNIYVDDDAADDPGPEDPTVSDPLEDGSPSHPYDSIQEAISTAVDGDTILVRPGTYMENINNEGKSIDLTSIDPQNLEAVQSTIIDGGNNGSVVTLTGAGIHCTIKGLTITGGVTSAQGGGICCRSLATITKNIIKGNTADKGGGIYCSYGFSYDVIISNNVIHANKAEGQYGEGGGICCESGIYPTIVNNVISSNHSSSLGGGGICIRDGIVTNNKIIDNSAREGGGILCHNGSVEIANNIISRNSTFGKGGGIWCFSCSATISNNTIVYNSVDWAGDSAVSGSYCSPKLTNCILWYNRNRTGDLSGCSATYSCIESGNPGVGNISAAPLFADTANGDHHLLSDSPCIDGGDNSALPPDTADLDGDGNTTEPIPWDLDGNPRIIGDEVDMGCYEYQVPGNQAPVLQVIGNKSVNENSALTFDITATDPDGDPITYSVQNLPSGAIFSNKTFSWTPTYVQDGSYQVTFIASDGQAQDSETIIITVNNVNRAPVLGSIADQSVNENILLSFSVNATDPDNQTLTYSVSGLPNGAVFAGQTFTWTPAYDQAGTFALTFTVDDGQAQDSQEIEITVINVNRAPMLTAIGNKSAYADVLLTFTIDATDPDGSAITYSTGTLPSGATFTSQDFDWTPSQGQVGSYAVTFTASDGQLQDSETVTITVDVESLAPTVTNCSPAADSIQVPLNSLIILHITDGGIGVDADSVIIQVNGNLVYVGDTEHYSSSYGDCRRMGTSAAYSFVYQSNETFDYDQTTTVIVNVTDLAGNVMDEYSYSFATEMHSFGQNKQVNSGLDNNDRPVTACDSSGNIWAAWHTGSAGSRDIYIGKLATGAENFDSAIQVTNNANDQCNPALALDSNDKPYAVWQDNREGDWDIYISTSVDGINWSTQTRVNDPNNGNQVNPAIVIDSQSPNYAHVVWQDDRAGNQDICIATSSDGFITKTISQITLDASDQVEPVVAADSANTIYVVWTDSRNGSSDIYGAASNNGPWTNVAVVSNVNNQSSPVIASESIGSILHLLWIDDSQGDNDIYYAASNGLLGSPLTGSSIIDDSSGANQLDPTIAVTGTGNNLKVFACWQDWRNTDTDLYSTELIAGSGTNVFVGDGGSNAYQGEPVIGIDEYGYPYIVWADNRSTNKDIYYAGSTFIEPTSLASEFVSASNGAIVGTDPASINDIDDLSVVIPSNACWFDVRITISKIKNPPFFAALCLGGYDFGPSGIQFNPPVTITIPYVFSDSDSVPMPYWFNPLTGMLSQQGITDVQDIVISPTLHTLSFKTTHFTVFYLLGNPAFTLNVTAVHGSVTKSPDKVSYSYGETVILQAVADTGYSFMNWSGDLSGKTNPTTIVVDSDKSITATFAETYHYHSADTNSDYVISMLEILGYIDEWSIGNVSMLEVLEAIDLWAAGHYYWDESEQRFKPGEQP